MNKLLSLMTMVALAIALSCDTAGQDAAALAANDCPIGTFRPEGLADCVFPADSGTGQLTLVSDNRCSGFQQALPPSCVSDSGRRPYYSTSRNCAPDYRFEPGVCQRIASTGGPGAGASTGCTDCGGTGGPTTGGGATTGGTGCTSTSATGTSTGGGANTGCTPLTPTGDGGSTGSAGTTGSGGTTGST